MGGFCGVAEVGVWDERLVPSSSVFGRAILAWGSWEEGALIFRLAYTMLWWGVSFFFVAVGLDRHRNRHRHRPTFLCSSTLCPSFCTP